MTAAIDTSEAARRAQAEALRRASRADRLRMALEMSEFVRQLTLRRIREKQPELSPDQAAAALLGVLYPAAVPDDA